MFLLVYENEVCPGEYPTTIDILITDSTDDTTIQNITRNYVLLHSQILLLDRK